VQSPSAFLKSALWPPNPPAQPWQRALLVPARLLYALVRDLAVGEINLRAMSLVYTSMISIVPLFGFVFAMAKALAIDDQMEPWLLELLQPLGPTYAPRIAANITAFAGNINGTLLGVVSIALLLVTVLSMAEKVESSFNFIWRVDRPRSFAQRFTEYLSVILIGPTIMLAAVTMIASLTTLEFVGNLETMPVIGPIVTFLGTSLTYLTPYLMIVAAFTFLYMFIPNTRVRFRPALIGGIVGGLSWATSGFLFAKLVVASASTASIYGGAAIVLVLMFWLYISWLVLLLGSALAFYVQNPFQLRFGQRTEPVDNQARERLSLAVMVLVATEFARPQHGWTNDGLAASLRMPRESLEPVIARLIATGLLVKASEKRLIPGKDPHRIQLLEIVATVRGGEPSPVDPSAGWADSVNSIVDRIEDAIAKELGERTLGQLVDAHLEKEATH
jgi:membrane protein